MNKKKGVMLLIVLVSLLSVVNAAWIISLQKVTINSQIIGEKENYVISREFDTLLMLNTSDGSASNSTNMTLEDLHRSLFMELESITKETIQ